MRYCLIVVLFAALPLMNVLAAPAPDPFAILDIGPPPKGQSAEEYREMNIEDLTRIHGSILGPVWLDPEVKKLPSVARLKEARPWLSKNLEITPVPGETRLRLKFRAGSRAEQVAILNSVLRVNRRFDRKHLQFQEEILHRDEACILDLDKRIESGQHPRMVASYQQSINDLRSIHIPTRRAEIARLKQIAVIRWAK